MNQNNLLDDEILVKDASGDFKILKGGNLINLDLKKESKSSKLLSLAHHEEILLPQGNISLALPSIDYTKITEEIIKESGLKFSDEVLSKRLRSIISACLKDLRDIYETEGMLMAPLKIGGLSLSREQVDPLIKLLEEKLKNNLELKKKTEEQIKKSLSEEKKKNEDLKEKKEKEEKKELDQRYASITGKKEIFPVKSASFFPKKENSLPLPKKEISLFSLKSKVSLPSSIPLKPPLKPVAAAPIKQNKILPPRSFSGRPRLEDIKFSTPSTPLPLAHLVGPIEELKQLTLIDFRRLSQNPQEAAQRIKEKIELLEKDSFSKMIQGAVAWKSSQVSQLFLEMSLAGLEKKKTIDQIIEERKNQNLPFLTNHEFIAIIKLNKLLRF